MNIRSVFLIKHPLLYIRNVASLHNACIVDPEVLTAEVMRCCLALEMEISQLQEKLGTTKQECRKQYNRWLRSLARACQGVR